MSAHLRQFPRFVDERKVEVEIADRAELQQLWTVDISKGGMFLQTSSPPPLGAQLQIKLSTPDSSIQLNARVVHVVDAASAQLFGHQPGVGVAFVDLSKEVRERIERYVDGLAGDLSGSFKVDRETLPLEILLDEAKRITHALNDSDLYRAISLSPDATPEQIASAIAELCDRFAHPPADCPPPKAARLVQLSRQLERTGTLFGNPLRRLHYDFHHGHVRAEQRAGAGQDMGYLRSVWTDVFPDRVEKARELAKRALAAEHAGRMEDCTKIALEALDNDPFNADLRRAVEAWQTGQRNATATVAPPPKQEDASGVMQELLEFSKKLDQLDHFQMLGLEPTATTQDVARTYLHRSRRFDPEQLRGRVPQSVIAMAEEYHRLMAIAYRTLTDPERRRQYLASKVPSVGTPANQEEVARTRNEMGLVYLRKSDYEQAREMFQAAMDLEPEVPEYQANFAWALIMDARIDRAEAATKARSMLLAALDKTPIKTAEDKKRRARYHYYLGRLMREQNQMKAAQEQLEEALELNPKLSEAATELRLIQMRTRKK